MESLRVKDGRHYSGPSGRLDNFPHRPDDRAAMSAEPPPPRKAWHMLGQGKLPITATLLLGFGGLVAVAVITVILISIFAARQTTNQLQDQMSKQRLEAAISRIDRYLTPAADDVAFLATQLSRAGGVSLTDDSRIETLMRG